MNILIILFSSLLNFNTSNFKSFKSQQVIDSTLRKESILDGKVTFYLPHNLIKLDDATLLLKYPNISQRPTYVFEDSFNKIKFSINYGSSNATKEDLPQIKAYFEKMYKNLSNNFISSDLKIINHEEYIVMRFELQPSPGSGKVFNYLFMTTIHGKLFMADYSFPAEQRLKQEKAAEDLLNSTIIKD